MKRSMAMAELRMLQAATGAAGGPQPSMHPLRFGFGLMALVNGTAPVAGRIRFGACVLDEGRGVLCAPDGAESVLRPKTLDLLRLLLRNAGRIVARPDILDAVWPNLFVTDDSITQCVVEIRKAMGGGGAEMLKTIPRRGYLLQAEVESESPPAASRSTLPEDRPSIAVLPFRKDGADPREAYFADGVVEGIVHVLSGLERIVVISRGSALAVAETTVDPREVGRKLGVRYVLYGGVRRAGDKLRITTELSDAESGAVLRSDRYDGETADLFALQDRIAEQAVTTIAPQVRAHELARALRKPPASLTAYDLVLQALDRLHRLDRASFGEARDILRRAIQADPAYALGHSYLAFWHILGIAQGWSNDVGPHAAGAGEAAAEALERDRDDALALALRGYALAYVEHDFGSAQRLMDQAVARSPSCALAWTAGAALRCWTSEGDEAVAWAERGARLASHDPFAFFHEHIMSQALDTAGRHADAALWAQRSIASNGLHSPSWRVLAASMVALGRLPEANAAAARVLQLEPAFRVNVMAARTPLRGAVRDRFVDHLKRAGLPA
jgi:adenylate cyclase